MTSLTTFDLRSFYKFRVQEINTHYGDSDFNTKHYVLEIFYNDSWRHVDDRMLNTLIIELQENHSIKINVSDLSGVLDDIYRELGIENNY